MDREYTSQAAYEKLNYHFEKMRKKISKQKGAKLIIHSMEVKAGKTQKTKPKQPIVNKKKKD